MFEDCTDPKSTRRNDEFRETYRNWNRNKKLQSQWHRCAHFETIMKTYFSSLRSFRKSKCICTFANFQNPVELQVWNISKLDSNTSTRLDSVCIQKYYRLAFAERVVRFLIIFNIRLFKNFYNHSYPSPSLYSHLILATAPFKSFSSPSFSYRLTSDSKIQSFSAWPLLYNCPLGMILSRLFLFFPSFSYAVHNFCTVSTAESRNA